MTPTLAHSPLHAAFEMLVRAIARRPRTACPEAPGEAPTPAADRARRAFVSEKLEASGEAFSSEYDVQAMMTFYADRF